MSAQEPKEPIGRCKFCNVNYFCMKDSLQHLQTKEHKQNVLKETGAPPPEVTVAQNQVDYSDEDQMKVTRMLHSFKTTYHICKADEDFKKFINSKHLFPIEPLEE